MVSGALANKPFNGGNAWSRLSWVSGLKRLGWEVVFLEQISSESCIGANGSRAGFEESANLAFFQTAMRQFGLNSSCALICDDGKKVSGLGLRELEQKAKEAVFLFNISGHLALPEVLSRCPCRVYYDDDPGYTQFWHAAGHGGARLDGHDFYFTLGANIGSADCLIPTGGLAWRPTRPPVVLAEWPAWAKRQFDRFTTIASWRGAYGPVEYGGKRFGVKAHEFRKFIALPQRGKERFEIALQIHPGDQKDLDALKANGWQIEEPKRVADSMDAFRQYVQNSGAEFSVAQGTYVETNSGWFSDRTVRYLASERPALVQETGFSREIPVGEGLLTFRTMDQAMEGVDRIVTDYAKHCRAARRIAEEYFDSDKVIGRMLQEMAIGS
jgi:hypothetical protein